MKYITKKKLDFIVGDDIKILHWNGKQYKTGSALPINKGEQIEIDFEDKILSDYDGEKPIYTKVEPYSKSTLDAMGLEIVGNKIPAGGI